MVQKVYEGLPGRKIEQGKVQGDFQQSLPIPTSLGTHLQQTGSQWYGRVKSHLLQKLTLSFKIGV